MVGRAPLDPPMPAGPPSASASTSDPRDRPGALVDAVERRFVGEQGLRQLSNGVAFSAAAPQRFVGRASVLRIGDAQISAFSATRHRAEPLETADRATAPRLAFVLLAEGTATLEAGVTRSELTPGTAMVFDSRQVTGWSTDGPVRLLHSSVDLAKVPRYYGEEPMTVALEDSALAASYAAFLSSLLQSGRTGEALAAAHLERALTALLSSLLSEFRGRGDLRARVLRLIEDHHADPTLDPASIAAALGISLRGLHARFNGGDRTVARAIRERRIATVRADLDAGCRLPVAALAARSGLHGADTLRRLFKDAYGMSVADYRASLDVSARPASGEAAAAGDAVAMSAGDPRRP